MSVTVHDGNSLFLINYATQILCFIVTTPFVLLRIFVRWKVNRALGIDDGTCATIRSIRIDQEILLTIAAFCFIGWVGSDPGAISCGPPLMP